MADRPERVSPRPSSTSPPRYPASCARGRSAQSSSATWLRTSPDDVPHGRGPMSEVTNSPSLEYLLVAAVAAGGSYLATPIARGVAVAWGAIARPRDRDVHAVATPRLGGLALLLGFSLAVFVAAQLPTLRNSFTNGPEIPWIVASGA